MRTNRPITNQKRLKTLDYKALSRPLGGKNKKTGSKARPVNF
jgi:hypothetical protein